MNVEASDTDDCLENSWLFTPSSRLREEPQIWCAMNG